MEPKDSELPHTPKLAYTINELAAATGVPRTRLFAELKAKRLDSTLIGRRRIVTLRQAHEWLAKYEAGEVSQ